MKGPPKAKSGMILVSKYIVMAMVSMSPYLFVT